MRVSIRLGEPFWRVVGQRNLERTLLPGANIGMLLATLCAEFPALNQELAEAPPHIFVNEEQADEKTPLAEGNYIVLVWAVAGG